MSTACIHCGFKEVPDIPPAPLTGIPQWRDLQRARLADTTKKIQDCRALLEKLVAERKALDGILKTFTYSVLTLPVEIVVLIFLHCLPTDGRVKPSIHRAPLLLAQICRQWREIALSTPELWTSVDLIFKPSHSIGGDLIDPWEDLGDHNSNVDDRMGL